MLFIKGNIQYTLKLNYPNLRKKLFTDYWFFKVWSFKWHSEHFTTWHALRRNFKTNKYYDSIAFLHTDSVKGLKCSISDLKLTSLMTGNGSGETSKKIHTDLAAVQLLSTVVTQKVISHKSFPICSLSFP